MKSKSAHISLIVPALAVVLFAGVWATAAYGQEDRKPNIESPRTESPPQPSSPPSAPPSAPPAVESPRSNDSGSSRSNDSGSSRNNDSSGNSSSRGGRDDSSSGRTERNDDNRRSAGESRAPQSRGTFEGDGSENRRDRVRDTSAATTADPSEGNRDRTRDRDRDGNRDKDRDRDRDKDRDRDRDRDRDKDRDKDRGGDRDKDRHRDRDRDRDRHRHKHGDRYPVYDTTTTVYESSTYGNYSYSRSAYDQGYEDGLYTGANDGRRGQSYDPWRSHFFKGATGGYNSGLGRKDVYQQAYRDGFLSGYAEGYRNWQRYFSGGYFHR